MTATRTMETQMAGLTQELKESEMMMTSSAPVSSSASLQDPSRQMTVSSIIWQSQSVLAEDDYK